MGLIGVIFVLFQPLLNLWMIEAGLHDNLNFKKRDHYFICNTPSLRYGILTLQNDRPADFLLFYQQTVGIFVLRSVLISLKFRKSLHCNFLKLHESITSMMRIFLLWESPVLLTSHSALQGYFNDEGFQLHQTDLDIVSQKILFLGPYGKIGCSLPQDYASLYFIICCKDFFWKHFSMMVYSRQTKII